MRAKKLATATKSARLHTATAPTNGQVLVCSDASGDEIILAWGNPGSITTTATALTDNSGGAAADGTIGAVTAPTTLTDNGGGTADGTVASLAAATTITDSTGLSGSHDDTLAAITNSMAGYVFYQNITAASVSAGGDQLDVSAGGGVVANLVQPDVPRNIVINFTDGDTSITAFQVDVVGTAPDGSAASEQFLFAGGLDQNGSVVFAKITSVTVTSIAGNAAGDALDIGYGVKLGVPVPAGATGFSIVKLVSNGTEEAASATDTTNNSFTATTAPNATNDYEVWFEYSHPALAILAQNVSDLGQKLIELVTWQGTVQNNFKELTTAQGQNRTAIVALTDAIKEITTQYNQLRSDVAT